MRGNRTFWAVTAGSLVAVVAATQYADDESALVNLLYGKRPVIGKVYTQVEFKNLRMPHALMNVRVVTPDLESMYLQPTSGGRERRMPWVCPRKGLNIRDAVLTSEYTVQFNIE